MLRIICIGNRYQPSDQAGPKVFDRLSALDLPAEVEVIDGGLAGIDLLRFFEGPERVVLVDTVEGFRNGPGVILVEKKQLFDLGEEAYGHAGGLTYLLGLLPRLLTGARPEISLVGVEGEPTALVVDEAAWTAMRALLGKDACEAWQRNSFCGDPA